MTLLSTLSRPITAEPAPPPAPQSQLTRTDSAPLLLTPLLCPPPPKSSDCDYCLVPIGFFFLHRCCLFSSACLPHSDLHLCALSPCCSDSPVDDPVWIELAALAGWIEQLDCGDHGVTCLVPLDLRVETGRETIWNVRQSSPWAVC